MRNPTMKNSRKVESKDHAKLIRELNDLERYWKSLQMPIPTRPHTPSPSASHSSISSSSSSATTIIASSHLLQTSPRTLMSSLQHRKPRILRGKTNNNDAVEEILMDRRAAISSGRFKGRQLFVEEGYAGSDDRRGDQRHELAFPEEEEEEEKTVVEVAEKRGGDGRPKEKGGGGCLLAATACLAVVLFVIALGLFAMSCNGVCVEESILVPT